jgi:hypothetical protein
MKEINTFDVRPGGIVSPREESFVTRSSHLLLILAFLGVVVSDGYGQVPDAGPAVAVPAPTANWQPQVLQELPRPLDTPRSLMAPAPTQVQTDAAAEAPYFQVDPLLDPPEFGQPGFFSAVEIQLIRPRTSDSLFGPETAFFGLPGLVVPGNGGPGTVQLHGVPLDWTASPKFTVGYRLPSGFGAFLMSYRFFNTQGSGLVPTAATGLDPGVATASETSRLSLNQLDIDYTSRVYTPYPRFGMRWWLGLRLTDFFYDSTAVEPGAVFGGIDRVQTTDVTLGIGAHAGVELDWLKSERTGLMAVSKLDLATAGAKTNQNFTASSSTLAAGAAEHDSRSTTIPSLNWQLGIGWQPPRWHATFFMGGQIEYWWNVGNNPSSLSRLNVGDYGIVWQAAFNF